MTVANSDNVEDLIIGFKKKRYFTRDFIKWVLCNYKLGTIGTYIDNKWTLSATYQWGKTIGLPNSLLELIQKDITIAFLCGRVAKEDCKTLDELFRDYQKLSLSKDHANK